MRLIITIALFVQSREDLSIMSEAIIVCEFLESRLNHFTCILDIFIIKSFAQQSMGFWGFHCKLGFDCRGCSPVIPRSEGIAAAAALFLLLLLLLFVIC